MSARLPNRSKQQPMPLIFTRASCRLQGFVDVYMGPDRTYKAIKLLPGTRYSFWVLVSDVKTCKLCEDDSDAKKSVNSSSSIISTVCMLNKKACQEITANVAGTVINCCLSYVNRLLA
jgi:hypothetical protein